MGSDEFTTLGKYLNGRQGQGEQSLRWGALGVILLFVCGAFALGVQVSQTVTESKVNRLESKIQTLQDQLEKVLRQLQTSEKKQHLARLSSRIKKDETAIAKAPTGQNRQRLKEDSQTLATWIDQNVDEDKDAVGSPAMTIEKGETLAQSAIRFRDDDGLYTVPSEVKKLTKRATWWRADAKTLGDVEIYSPTCPKWEPDVPELRGAQSRSRSIDITRLQ